MRDRDEGEEERGGRYKQTLRDSDIPEEPKGSPGRWALGCVAVVIGALLIAGTVGLVVGGARRLADLSGGEGGGGEEGGRGQGEAQGEGQGQGQGEEQGQDRGQGQPGDPTPPQGPSPEEALAEMRRRYLAGPFIEVANLVPSGRLFASTTPSVSTSAPGGRTVRTPWMVSGARLHPEPAPGPSASEAPSISHAPGERATEPLTVIPGTPVGVEVEAHDAGGGSAIRRYLISFDGYPGHFELDATVPTELGWVQAGGSEGARIHLGIRTPARPDGSVAPAGQPFSVTARLASVDRQGRISPYVTRPLLVQPVGTGDVEVTLTMGEATDMDLYVDSPSGETIYYGNRNSSGGGHLDLDANAACSSNMGVNNEHIFWPRGGVATGWYRVRVAHYESCISGRPVSFRITVQNCGETAIFTGGFDGRASSQSCTHLPTQEDRWWCQDVVRFYVPQCEGSGATPL